MNTQPSCDCGAAANNARHHKVWCAVYGSFVREHATERKEAEVAETRQRTAAQLLKSNVCKRCREVIRSVDEAILIEGVDEESYLIHATLDCYESEVEALLDRFLPAEETKAVA